MIQRTKVENGKTYDLMWITGRPDDLMVPVWIERKIKPKWYVPLRNCLIAFPFVMGAFFLISMYFDWGPGCVVGLYGAFPVGLLTYIIGKDWMRKW